MLVELGLLVIGNYLTYKYITRDYKKFDNKFNSIVERIPRLKNIKKEYIKLEDYELKDYGYKIKLIVPAGIIDKNLIDSELALKKALKLTSIQYDLNNNIMYCIKNYNYKKYQPYKTSANNLFVGEFIDNYILIDMNKFPHLLVSGDTGTGKSCILFSIITNLIFNKNVELYLLQLRKSDLSVFKNYKQVKVYSKTLEEIKESLKSIDEEIQKREKLFEENHCNSIVDFNKRLKYIYVIIEEFSFLNNSKADSKEIKQLKDECLACIKNIINVGRSSGVFLITSLQKPTSDSIPSDIKSQLRSRISLDIADKSTSEIVMGDNSAVGLSYREFVLKTKGITKGFSLTINQDIIKKHLGG